MRNAEFRVMHLIGNLDIGGAQEVVRTLVAYLAEAGCRPIVGTFQDGPLRQELERLGIPVEVLPRRRYSILALPLFVVDMIRIRRALVDVVERYEIDVVQTHLLRVLDFLVLTLRLEARTLLIFWTVHNYNFALREDQLPRFKWLLGPKRAAHRLLYRFAARWVDGFVAVSDEVESAIVQTIGPVASRITVICNGVDARRYRRQGDKVWLRRELGLPDDARLLAMVGTLKEQKGHRYLIEAAASLLPRDSSLHILLIGDGPLRESLRAQIDAAGLDARIHFLGSRDDVPALLAASDYFVLPSLWEGLPMALLEAMASGLPIVATDVSGTKQVMIPGETGLVVPPGDVRRLEEAIAALLSDPSRAQAMGAAARKRVVEAYSATVQAEEHVRMYRRARDGARRGALKEVARERQR